MLVSLGGCATTPKNPDDPFERFNRAMFKINEGIDVVAKPVAQGYDAVAPLPVKAGLGNFFSNLADIRIAINNMLQGKFADGFSDIGRFLINSIIGIGGVFDVASEMGLEKNSADFGQTLGIWGVGEGPFFYWPIIGPRTARDTFSFAVDLYAHPLWHVSDTSVRYSIAAVQFVDIRARMLPVDRVIEQAAFDRYSYIRDAYLQSRRRAIPRKSPQEYYYWD